MHQDRIKETRSGEVQELLSHAPHWIIRWGLMGIFVLFTILAGLTWFIKVPEVTVEQFSVISENDSSHSVRLRLIKNKDLLDKLKNCQKIDIAFNEFPLDTFSVIHGDVSNIFNFGANRFIDIELFIPDRHINSQKFRLDPAGEKKGSLFIFHQSSLIKRIIDTIGIHNKS